MPIAPTKLIRVMFLHGDAVAFWEAGDPADTFYGFPFRYNATLTITAQPHSDPATTTPFFYNGLDIKVGDWVATVPGGSAMQVVSIGSQNDSVIECVVEDIDRYNTFADPTGGGAALIPDGDGVVFSLADDGLPMLGPMPSGMLPTEFQIDLISRFRSRNPLKSYYEVHQPDHGFAVGDAIYLVADNTYHLADSAHADKLVGFVTSVGVPSAEYFTYRAIGTVVTNLSPALPGDIGDLIYVSDTQAGKYTATRPASNARAVFIKLSDTTGIQIEQTAQAAASTEKAFKPASIADGQTVFTLPSDAKQVIEMSINGIENLNFTFAAPTLTFDPDATGYGVETTDEVIFVYTT